MKTEASPTIRTKTNLLPATLDEAYQNIILGLYRGELDADEYLSQTLDFFGRRNAIAVLNAYKNQALTGDSQLELLRRHIDDCRYTILLYRVDENEVHPPHHHFNVISTQVVIQGKLRLREYDRVRREGDGTLILRLVRDELIGEGASFQASEWKRNVHWFQAVDGPALIFNTNARGFEPETFDHEDAGFGRRYIDPTAFITDDEIRAEEFSDKEAKAKFSNRSLDSFPTPRDGI